MDRHRNPSPGVDGRGKGQVGQSEDDTALNDPDSVAVMPLQPQLGPGPAVFCIQQLDPHVSGKAVFAEKGLQRIGNALIVHSSLLIRTHPCRSYCTRL